MNLNNCTNLEKPDYNILDYTYIKENIIFKICDFNILLLHTQTIKLLLIRYGNFKTETNGRYYT